METPFTDSQFRRFIYPAFPDAPRPPRKFTIDELVCTFLALHDVEVAPVGADIHMSRGEATLLGAAFGLTSPVVWDTMATGAQMKQDARIAARQEWNSWKQWALSHADWPAFKAKANADYEAAQAALAAWVSDPANQERFKDLVEQGQARALEESQKSVQMTFVGLGLLAGAILMLQLVNFLGQQSRPQYSPNPAPTQSESR